jgi:hypothetical protein
MHIPSRLLRPSHFLTCILQLSWTIAAVLLGATAAWVAAPAWGDPPAEAKAETARHELSIGDFRFDGPLGSGGAKLEKLGPEHFQVTLSHAPGHPDWANNCQFQITRNAKGNRLLLDVRFDHPKPQYAFDEYFHSRAST